MDLMEQILSRENLQAALKRVEANIGFSFHKQKGIKVRIAPKSLKRVRDKIREITNPT